MRMFVFLLLGTVALPMTIAAPVMAQSANSDDQQALPALRPEGPGPGMATLRENTEILLRLDQEVNSKKARVGDKFQLSVVQDIKLGDFIVIPRGTPATGTVSYRTGKGAFGKSAKMEITIDSLSVGERVVPLSGKFREEGRGNTGATVGTAVAAGVFAAFVTGRSAIFKSGREFRVATREPLPVSIPQ